MVLFLLWEKGMGKQVVHVVLIGDIITMVILTRNIQRKWLIYSANLNLVRVHGAYLIIVDYNFVLDFYSVLWSCA